jgi:hypothetical protein
MTASQRSIPESALPGEGAFPGVDRDWRDGGNVIDIVAVERCVFVCDVKTHSRTRYGPLLEAI